MTRRIYSPAKAYHEALKGGLVVAAGSFGEDLCFVMLRAEGVGLAAALMNQRSAGL